MESWVFLLVGGVGASGAALSLGTLAALVRYERTGEVPGQHDQQDARDAQDGQDAQGSDADVVDPGPGVRRRLLLRIVLGAVVAGVCFSILAEQGLLGGPVLG